MRHFKYLILFFLSIISVSAFAAFAINGGQRYPTAQAACTAYNNKPFVPYNYPNPSAHIVGNCGEGTPWVVEYPDPCPPYDYPGIFYIGENGEVPTQRCMQMPAGHYCKFSDHGRPPVWINLSGGSDRLTRDLYSDSPNAALNCTDLNDGECDKRNPYGACYVPPDDHCVRQANGSIVCPNNEPPPIQQGCENGATYCKRPAGGCGSNYVSGSFNGQQICVKKGDDAPPNPNQPNDPDHPEDPNKCTATSCPKPDPNKDCPIGYYQTSYHGQSICVLNNPNPNQPNPNDPNNQQNPNDPTDPNLTNDFTGVINAIRALKDSLLGSLATVSKKLTDLINGQTKTNEKLDKSNEHLNNIDQNGKAASEALGNIDKQLEENGKAASEAAGQTNKKLDSIKESIDSQSKCKDSNGNLRECTEQDFKQETQDQTKVDVQDTGIDLDNDLKRNLFSSSSTCPPPLTINITFIAPIHLEFPMTLLCDGAALVRPWVILLGLLISYFIITGQRSGAQD